MTKVRTVYSTQDDGTGTLRDALRITASYTSEWIDAGALENGDIIDFSDELEEGGVITILLSYQLSLPAKNLTIDGGSHTGSGATLATRVVLDAQQLGRVIRGETANKVEIYNVTFKDGQLTGSNYGANVNTRNSAASGTNVFEYCVFKQTYSGSAATGGGGLYAASSSQNSLNNCTFDSCSTTNGGGLFSADMSQNTLTNCTFVSCSATNGGGLYSYSTSQNSLNNCTFNACSASGAGGGLYATNTSQNILTGCVFIPPENNTNTTIHNNGTNADGSLIINGATSCDRVQFAANSTTVINGKLTAEILTISIGASITFSGVDRILAATTIASIGAATFTAAADSTGYAAFPTGTDISAAMFTGVSVATYSATAATVSATVAEREATITTNADVATSVVEAIYDDSTLSPLSVSAGKAAISKDRAFKVRLFNGAFYESSWVPRTYYYQGGTTGSFAVASDWAMDSAKTLTCNASPTIANSTFDCR